MLYAWISGVQSKDIPNLLGMFKGKVGGVLYPSNYDMLSTHGNWIAFVGGMNDAKELVEKVKQGGEVITALVQDERNITGLSGSFLHPSQYADLYNPIYDLLHDNEISVSTMGLAGLPGFLSFIAFNTMFDDTYFSKVLPLLHGYEYNAFNPGNNRLREIDRVLNVYTERPWLLSPHPLNPQWFPLKQNTVLSYVLENYVYHENTPYWVQKSKDPRLLGVAIWSLRYNWMNFGGKKVLQKYCNIFTLDNKLTVVGKQLLASLQE